MALMQTTDLTPSRELVVFRFPMGPRSEANRSIVHPRLHNQDGMALLPYGHACALCLSWAECDCGRNHAHDRFCACGTPEPHALDHCECLPEGLDPRFVGGWG